MHSIKYVIKRSKARPSCSVRQLQLKKDEQHQEKKTEENQTKLRPAQDKYARCK